MTINRVLELMIKAPADLITHDVTEYMKAGFENHNKEPKVLSGV